jgi:hypothetical protein
VGNVPRVTDLIENWNLTDTSDEKEHARRLVDLFFVSVLLDAGAGDHWRYTEPHREGEYERSEGIAVASLYMFVKGAFAAEGKKSLVDGNCLHAINSVSMLISTRRKGFGSAHRRGTGGRLSDFREQSDIGG